MGRLRIRNPRNSDWIDICQSEWYVRNPANDGWRRLLPSHGLRARHGTDNYWVNIDCLSEDACGDDEYGGTPDGKGANGSGPDLGGPGGGPGGPGGSRDPWGGWGGGYWGSGGPWGGGSPWTGGYPWNSGGTWGGGYGNGGKGGWGSGPNWGGNPGGPGGGGGAGGPGNPSGPVGGGNSTGGGDGTHSNAYGCGQTVADQHYKEMPNPDYQQYRSYYHTLTGGEGNVHIRFLSTSGRQRYRIYYGDKLLHTTKQLPARRTGEPAPRDIEYFYWEGNQGGDGVVRVEVEGTRDSIFLYTLYCPNELFQIQPCNGLFSGGPSFTGSLVQETMHDMGDRKGVVEVMYHFMWTAAKFEAFHGGKLIASSPGFTQTGTPASNWHDGILEFEFDPANADGDTILVVRITSTEITQGWTYNLWCPDPGRPVPPGTPAKPGNGSKNSPKWCGGDNGLTLSGGAGVTDTYYDLGDEEGSVRIRYQMWSIPDQLTVYQDGNIVAATDGFVSGEDALFFDYQPENGREILVRVEGSGEGGGDQWEDGETSWAYVVDCAELEIDCGESWSGTREKPVRANFGSEAGADQYSLVEYTTVNTNIDVPNGAPNRIQIENDSGVIIEDTGENVLRWEDHAFGTLPIPVAESSSISVRSVDAKDYWRFLPYCPVTHGSDGPRFEKFTQGLSKMVEASGPEESGALKGARQIRLAEGMIMPGNSAFMTVSMFYTSGGGVRFSGKADDYASVLIMAPGRPADHVASFVMEDVTTTTVSLAAGVYFIYVLVENGPANTPGWLTMKAVDVSTGKPVLATSSDWRGSYFESKRSLPSGNKAIMPEVEALIFEDDAQAQNYVDTTPPPSLLDVFNTWGRSDGADYYDSASVASGSAAAWIYDSNNDRFIMTENTARPNAILSPDRIENYRFAATLTSAAADDDTIGLVIAGDVIDGTPHLLVVARSKAGLTPNSGYGLLYVVGNSVTQLANWGGHGDDTSGGWSGARTRVDIRRRGDAFTVTTRRFNGGDFPTANFNLDDFEQTKKFKGPSRYGYYTHSQRGSTYENVYQPFVMGRVFSASTNKTWEAGNGIWIYQGSSSTIGAQLDWPCVAKNPVTEDEFYVYRVVTRKI